MTVNLVNAFQLFEGDGVVTAFPFSFPLSTGASVKALRLYPDRLPAPLEPSEFSVVLDGSGIGGVLTTALGGGPLPLGEKLYVYRETPASQLVSVTGQTSYDPIVVMRVWDKLTMLVQEIQAKLARATLVSPDADPTELLSSIAQAVVDAEAAADTAVAAASAAATFDPALYLPLASTTPAGRALLDAADTAAQRETLGLVIGTNVQAHLGFTPVEQGGGTNMGSNKVRLGWRTDGAGLLAQVDATPIGMLAMKADVTSAIAAYSPSTAQVLVATAGAALGAVGSYAFLAENASGGSVTRAPGDTVAGSRMRFADSAGAGLSPLGYGTWRLLGLGYSISGASNSNACLWLRVS